MKFFTERRNAFWLSLAFAMTFACAPVFAQAAPQNAQAAPPPPGSTQQPPPPPPRLTPEQRDAQRTIPGAYRLTYTLTEMDGNKRIGSQRYAIVLDGDARPSHLNLQSSIPVAVSTSPGASTRYIRDMKKEMRIDSNLRQFANGMELSTRIQQNTFANGANDGPTTAEGQPITRESSLQSTVLLTKNKPVTIGQLDIPGSTHSMQIQVKLTQLP